LSDSLVRPDSLVRDFVVRGHATAPANEAVKEAASAAPEELEPIAPVLKFVDLTDDELVHIFAHSQLQLLM